MSKLTIAVDAMGGDHGPEIVVPGCVKCLSEDERLHIILVGPEPYLKNVLASYRADQIDRIQIYHAPDKVEMDDPPGQALRTKRKSSMWVAIELVKNGDASACVSAGNTGALMLIARYVLKTLPGIDRPAFISAIPTTSSYTYMLDLGANVDCTPEQLLQFALMGSAQYSVLHGTQHPTVALLNIGVEDIKGNEVTKRAARLFADTPALNYVGFVEADQIFHGVVDVIVCDGFIGNIALKATEGAAKLVGRYTKEGLTKNWLAKLRALPVIGLLKEIRKQIDPDEKNGANLIGLEGIVIKSHGGAGSNAFAHAIKKAQVIVQENLIGRIHHKVEAIIEQQSKKPEGA